MTSVVITDEQLLAKQPTPLFIEACPGAGKTTTLAIRHEYLVTTLGQTVASLSFTNRAVDSVRQKLRHSPQCIGHPNYIGTFDSFIRDFVVRPVLSRRTRRDIRFVDQWGELEDTGSRTVSFGRFGSIPLSAFRWTRTGLTLDRDNPALGPSTRVLNSYGDSYILDRAAGQIRELESQGVLDASTTRFRAMEILDENSAVLNRIGLRFNEVIVDEFQDCDEVEHSVLRKLLQYSANISVIADRDQMIYEFRGASPTLYQSFTDLFPPRNRIRLTTNFRSVPAICRLAGTLSGRATADEIRPSDRLKHDSTPVFVLYGTDSECRTRFAEICDERALPKSSRIVVSSRWVDAAKLAGGSSHNRELKGSLGDKIAYLSAMIRKHSLSVEERREFLRKLENHVLAIFEWDVNSKLSSRSSKLLTLDRTDMWLRTVTVRVLAEYSAELTHTVYANNLRSAIRVLLDGEKCPLPANLGSMVRCKSEIWQNIARSVNEIRPVSFSSIHGVKGDEFDAVLINVDFDALKDSISGLDSGPRRLLYVGATRARTILALRVSSEREASVLSNFLSDNSVPHETLDE